MLKVCSSCHKTFNEGVDVPIGYMLKVESAPYSWDLCYDCAKELKHPAVINLQVPLNKGLLRECEKCHRHLPAKQVQKHPVEHFHLCPTCTAKVNETNAKPSASFSKRTGERTGRANGGIDRRLAVLRQREAELTRENERLKRSRPLTLGDELKAGVHDRANAVAKALSRNVGFFDGGSLQDHQLMNKRIEANQRQSRLPRPRRFLSLDALIKGQRNSRKADGLSGSAPGDATEGAEQVVTTASRGPQSYAGYETSRRDDYFSDVLPGSAANSDPARDYYPDSTSASRWPRLDPEGASLTRTIADASPRDADVGDLGIRLFNGESSAFFTPASASDRFVGSSVIIRTPTRATPDVAKLAATLAMQLRRGPKVFGRNL
jgi:hypothetical protein